MIERFIREGRQLLRLAAMDPVEAWIRLQSRVAELPERRRPRFQLSPYTVTDDWERRLHDILGVPWPCPATVEFWNLWPEVIKPFVIKGVHIGRGAFGGWGDGEPGLARAAWCLVRHLEPANVVETGVARGFTSRVILEALERNGGGHLWSIDLPPPLHPELHAQIGAAVRDGLHHRWSYIKGSSRRRLPQLLAEIGQIGLFIHDSAHTEDNVRFELDRAWARLKPGGAVMADDIDYNWGFYTFQQANPHHRFLICRAEPLEPDPSRFDAKGLFGIAQKASSSDSP
ncbi:MAG TPA: class I SAM-dependent methyltransferase [Methylocella sp.]|nr:class I SAM-dependent methyltransferase [Methylocella sp.]